MFEEPTRKPIPMKVKRQVYKRAKGRCEKCGIRLRMSEGDFHHTRDATVTPRASSVRFLCLLCHRKYGHKHIARKSNIGTFWEKTEVRTIPREVVKFRKKKPKTKRVAVRGIWGEIISYRTVKIRKHRTSKKTTCKKTKPKTRRKRKTKRRKKS